MRKYVLSAAAEIDLETIWEYIAEDNIDAADRWVDKLFDAFEALAQVPGMGHAPKISLRSQCGSGRLART